MIVGFTFVGGYFYIDRSCLEILFWVTLIHLYNLKPKLSHMHSWNSPSAHLYGNDDKKNYGSALEFNKFPRVIYMVMVVTYFKG